MKPLPSQDDLRAAFDYDPESGVLSRTFAGPIGYLQVWLGGRKLYAHRVIWKWMTGEEPGVMDHRDRNRSNNRWSNLRNGTWTTNNRNRGLTSRNSTGVKGVVYLQREQRYRAQISRGKRIIWTKHCATLEEAAEAVRLKRIELHGDEACHG